MHAIAYSIPVFGLLIGFELWLAHRRGRKLFRFGDAVSNISCGIGQQTVGLFVAAATVALYIWVYQYRLWDFDVRSPWTWVLAMLWVDFGYYWWHRLSHEVNLLWAVHIVHHQSEDYNLSVALRQAYVSGPTAIAFYLPLAIVGVPPEAWALSRALNLLYQFWIHTELIDKMGWFGKVFNTPSHHRVHHAINGEYLDRNYAGILIIWDKLFGSFEPERARPVYGTTKPLHSYNAVWANFEHHVEIVRKAAGMRGLGNGFRAVFGHPGWGPSGPAEDLTKGELEQRATHKFDPQASRWTQLYVAMWLGLASAAIFGLLLAHATLPLWATATAVALIVWTTASFGGLLEAKRWAWGVESTRLAACGAWGVAWFLLVL